MATNLLLEGDDLEALLVRARVEGGPNARIVRAEKVRAGGVFGFFARELFEVAVEIPDDLTDGADGVLGAGGALGADGGPASGAPGTGVASDPDAVVPRRRGLEVRDDVQPDGPILSSGPDRTATAAPWATRAPVVSGRHEARTGSRMMPVGPLTPARPAGSLTASAAGDAAFDDLSERMAVIRARAGVPEQGALAADGLLSIVDRVSAAERAAARASAGAAVADLAGVRELAQAREVAGAARPAQAAAAAYRAAGAYGAATGTDGVSGHDRAGHAEPQVGATPSYGSASPYGTPYGVPSPAGGVPGFELPSASARSADARPEFTALLDHLRSNARSRQHGEGTVVPMPLRPQRPQEPADDEPADDDAAPDGQAAGHAGAPAYGLAPEPTAPTAPAAPTGPRGLPPLPMPTPLPAAPDQVATAPAPAPAPSLPADRLDGAQPGRFAARPDHEDDEDAAPRSADPRVAHDRQRLRELGVPVAWTRRMRPGDRFAAVLRVLDRMPELDVDPDTPVVAVVGSPALVHLEAARIAVDLAADAKPRPVVAVPLKGGAARGAAISRAQRAGVVVVAVEADGYARPEAVVETLEAVGAGAVVAVVEATLPLEESQRWVDALGQVDAVCVDGATSVAEPAAVLQLGLPVIRLDGVPLDQVTWTALLCAQLEVSSPAEEPQR